jgi:P pilus assembly chaperone PapD
MQHSTPQPARRRGASSVFALFVFAGAAATARAQDVPPGWVLVDDLVLPADVVFGDSTFGATAWPGGTVPYDFDANVSAANQLIAIDAMAEWAAAAALTFVPRTTQANYIKFKDSGGNSSFVGMIGGAQTINIYNWGFRFIVCHEICHALGFWHEQSRPDRNTYITVNTANIDPVYLYNFNIVAGATTYGSYDFDSIMHYGQYAFSINGQPSITVLPPNGGWQGSIGQRQHLSLSDATGMATQYGAAPAPTITTLSPPTVAAGGAAFTLTVNGTKFCRGSLNGAGMPGTVVEWDGVALATTYVSPTQLTASVPASYIASGGAHTITVYNGSPGGGVSVGVNFNVGTPPPTLTSLTPPLVYAGTPAFTLGAVGSGFAPASVVSWDGAPLGTTYVDGSHLNASISAAMVAVAGTHAVTVSTPGGGVSSSVDFNVNHYAPILFGVSPTSVVAGSGSFVVTANGAQFDSASVVRWNGSPLATTYVSSTQLTAVVPAASAATPGSASVSVQTPAPGGGTTLNQTVSLTNGNPSLATLSPASAPQFGASFTLNLTGAGFNGNSVAKWNNANLSTTFVDSTHLTATIPSANLVVQGTYNIKVTNTGAGGGSSANVPFTVTAPAPVLSTISPTTATAGAAGFTLTANGSFFQAGSKVRWNGADLVTTFGSVAQLTAAVPAALIANPGTATVTVFNPSGGWTSGSATFTVIPGVPALTLISPSTATVGSAALTLTATGSGFDADSVVRWNGVGLTTVFGSSTSLTATVPAANLTAAATAAITVFTPAPGGGTSGSLTFTVQNPQPAVTSLSPSSALAGASQLSMVVTGSGFVSGASTVRWNGNPLATSFQSATQLTATVPAANLAAATSASVTVFNAAPGGGSSGTQTFTVNNPTPFLISISPLTATAGDASFTLQANGVNFNASSQIRWNGVPLATTQPFVTQLQAVVAASLIAKAGAASITVFNPAPGGGTSGAQTFNVIGPHLTSSTPSTIAPMTGASPPVTLALAGTRFLPSSIVWANGVQLSTTYFGATSLSCSLTSAVEQTSGPGGVALVVRNGGTASSNAVAVTVGGGGNLGTQVTDPPFVTPPWGGTFNFVIEGCAPGMPFTLLLDLAATPTLTGFPTPAANFALDVGSPSTLPVIDGLGLFGPPFPIAFGPNVGGTPPGGSIVFPNLSAPAAPTGVDYAVQAAYLDASSPVGWRLTWAAQPRPM